MSAATPGQAAYEAWGGTAAGWNGRLNTFQQAGWETIGQAAVDAFLAGDSVSAESIREALAAQEPHAADGTLRSELEAVARTLHEESEPYPGEDAAEVARRGGFGYAAGQIDEILARHPEQPAPELAALREQVRLARQDRDQLRGQVLSLAADLEESAARTAPSKKTDIENAAAARLRKIAEPA